MSEDCRSFTRGATPSWASHVTALLSLVTLLLVLAPPASAQYMFLDVNRNGIPDDFWDFLQNDSSTVDVYLVTDRTLYGDPAYCQPAPGLNSYTVNLYCPQEAATFTNIRNLMPGMSEAFPAVVTRYGITVAYSGPTLFPPGKYLLFRVDVKPDRTSAGCPDIEIWTSDCFAPDGVVTSFGSGCTSPEGDDILRYGLEWFDVVGVGGCTDFPGRVPVVTCPAAVTGRELQPLSFAVSVFDPDCSIFSFYSSPFPSGASFVGSGPIRDGLQGGTLVWTPARGQAGTYSIRFTASDAPYGLPPSYKYWDEESTRVTILPEQVVHNARVFTTAANRVTRLPHGKPSTCFQLESSDGSFAMEDIALSSLRLHYGNTACGDHDIAAGAARTMTVEDTDGNGRNELAVCFDQQSLSVLFPCLGAGTTILPLELSGTLANGDLVRGTVSQSFTRTGPALAAVAPNPINGGSAVEFTTTRQGFARVQVFDVQGRRVANTLDASLLESGYHRVPLVGRGVIDRLASGVYFVRVATEHDGSETHAVRIVR